MAVTRPRRLASSTVSTSRPTPRQSGSTQRASAACDTDSITNVKNNNNNNGSSNDGDDDEEKEEEDNNNHGKRNLQTSSRIPEQTDNSILKSHLPSESKKVTSLTARGTRGTRRRIDKKGLVARGKMNRKSGFFSDGDDDGDVEEPRLHYLESVVIPDYPRTTKGIDIFKEVAGRARKAQKDYKAIFSVYEETPSSATKTIESDTAFLEDSSIQLSKSQRMEQIEYNDDDPNSLLFSRLSLTPPPMMFELEEGFESMETPWQMVFDSAQSSSSLDPQPRIKIAELTLADLAHRQEDGQLDDIVDDFEEQDDDPFGFTKVERQLERTKNLRPKLLAINEVNNRAFVAAAAGTTTDTKGSTSGNRFDGNRTGALGNRLDRIVLERSAARKRGDVKNKGKAVDRGVTTLSDINNASGTRSDVAEGVMDLDLQKAIQLSKSLDIASGKGSSSTAAPAISSGAAGNETQSTTLTEQPLTTQDDEATPSIAAIRSSRRISRMYGKSTAVHDSQDTQIASKDPTFSADNNSTASDNNSDMSDFAFTFTKLPSTPQKPADNNNNNNNNNNNENTTTTSRTSQQDFRLSIGSDDLSPIVIRATPQKKPEAGMPSSLESPSTSKTNRNARPKKYMRTEQLEALLPRRRRPKEGLSAMRKGASIKSSPRVVLSSESDIESESDSDDASASSELSSSEEEDEDEEEEEAQHRGQLRKRPAKTTSANQVSSKKRRAPAKSKIPQAKRTLASSKSNVSTAATTNSSSLKSKGKEKEKEKGKEKDDDKSGWTASQLAAHKERIKYFQQVDDFELEVETF
ncbi:hypothetical protein BGX26_008950 [Mortierella sp. AD094]|nr:hypothetical protein BGX26_008950 [Mortierella sp. AD094]